MPRPRRPPLGIALFPDPAEADVIRDALAAGDLAALRQMFAGD
ncbi:hypothetical protein [Microbacterium sp. BH-3-3-3]|nr:hypothetical protein [Microbacterium sp. BH-3-3-3]